MEKADLKLNIQKSKIMASGPITSWQIDVKKVEAVTDFILLGFKITVDSDRSHEIKKTLTPWKKSYDKPRQHIKKLRHCFADEGLFSQIYMVFPVAMYGCESWTVKKAECQRIDAFELCCWRRLLESPLDCKEIQPVHPKGDQSWVVLEEMMLKFGQLMQRADSLEKTLMLGGIEGRRRRG